MRIALFLIALVSFPAVQAQESPEPGAEQPVRITLRATGLVHGALQVPVSSRIDVVRTEIFLNGVRSGEARGQSVVFSVNVGKYLRRLRVRVVGYDARGSVVGIDEMTINDPQPPFRLRLQTPGGLPETGLVDLTASVSVPSNLRVQQVEFFVGETSVGVDVEPPWHVQFEASDFEEPLYARAVARATGGLEANDISFWGNRPREMIDVVMKQIPLSVAGRHDRRLTSDVLTLYDDDDVRTIESLAPASDQPLNVILLLDSSESMLDELPIIQKAAKEFARSLIRPTDRIAIVGFHQRLFWLTPFTSDIARIEQAVDQLRPRGQTHLYDAVIRSIYELQKMPGRKAIVVFTDGVNQGGDFELDHLVHYARYSGVPIYPVVRNEWLSRFMRFGIRSFDAKRFADIAKETGATYFIIRRTEELPAVYRTISEELRQQYLLTFRAETDGEDRWHNLRVVPDDRSLQIRIPRGYFP